MISSPRSSILNNIKCLTKFCTALESACITHNIKPVWGYWSLPSGSLCSTIENFIFPALPSIMLVATHTRCPINQTSLFHISGTIQSTTESITEDSVNMLIGSSSSNSSFSSPYSSLCNRTSTCYGGVYQGEYSLKEVWPPYSAGLIFYRSTCLPVHLG